MAEIPGIPAPKRRKQPRRRKVTTSKDWVERGALVPWMMAYAQWLSQQPAAQLSIKNGHPGHRRGPPGLSERTAKASLFSKAKIPTRVIRLLERREDFVEYFNRLRSDAQFQARELMQQDLAKNIEARRMALNVALDMVPDPARPGEMKPGPNADPRMVESFTRWVTDVAFPKKVSEEGKATRITINIGSASEARGLIGKVVEGEEIQDVDYEVIETRLLESGDDNAA